MHRIFASKQNEDFPLLLSELVNKIVEKCLADFALSKQGGPVPHDWALDWFGENIDARELTTVEYEGLLKEFYSELENRRLEGLH